MSTATPESIRDRSIVVIEYIDPVYLSGDRFRRWRNEGKGDFRSSMETAPQLRRFQVRNVGNDSPPLVSTNSFERRLLTLEIVIAYPQTHRAGSENALDRDDIIEQDWVEIDFNLGICGRGNFAGSFDCTPLGCTKEIERGDVCDFLVIRAEYEYERALMQNGGLVVGLGLGFGE